MPEQTWSPQQLKAPYRALLLYAARVGFSSLHEASLSCSTCCYQLAGSDHTLKSNQEGIAYILPLYMSRIIGGMGGAPGPIGPPMGPPIIGP